MKNNKRYDGFTMIELLTVITIIALLMSILLPALNATREEAYKTVCITNLGQWGYLFTLYTEDHNGRFFAGDYHYTDPNGITYQNQDSDLWFNAMQPYHEDSGQAMSLKFCPVTRSKPGKRYMSRSAWQMGSESGSYGLNAWVCDTPAEVRLTQGHDTRNSWRKMFIGSRGSVPLMADALWFSGRPENKDLPSEQERYEYDWANQHENEMQRFCADRHRDQLNVLFLDGNVKTINPKGLWQLKWHKTYQTFAPPPEWPEWMSRFGNPK